MASALTCTSRFFSTRVFSKMHTISMSSVALPACCFPRNNPFPSILGHTIRRLRLVLIRPPVVCEQDFGAPCPIDLVLVGNIHNDSLGIALLATVMMDRVQTRRSHLTVGHQRGKCIGSNCVRPSGLASVGCVCFMYCVCWVGNVSVVQSVNGVILLVVQTPLYHFTVSCFCVRGDPARGTFLVSSRRLKFSRATVLTSTNGNCCCKFRVGACSHSVRKVCVLSLDACEVRLPRERHMFFSDCCFSHMDIWYSECHVIVLGIAFFVQGVCVCVV